MVSRRWLDVSGGSFYPGGKYVSRPPADWISINEIVSKNNKTNIFFGLRRIEIHEAGQFYFIGQRC